ncbi:MAG: HlyD family efflux transporter periplasmic adaptor subunit [Flavobacteriales bacterium]|nr:HlyD family efflux transporter periplasmic adaptor subunit [Flavobacteriales bacterium]
MNDLFKRRLTVIIGLLLLVGGVATCKRLAGSRSSPERTNGPAAPRPVRVLEARNGPVRISIPVSGRVRATDRMLITAEVGGALQRTSKPFREGTSFSKGELLFRIDEGEVRAQINAQQSAFIRDLVQLVPDLRIDRPEEAAKWEAYLKSVPIEGVLPALPVLSSDRERNYLAGRGVLDKYYSLRALYERMAKYAVTAPFDGVVTTAGIEPGTIITPGTRLGELIAPNTLELESAVGAGELRHVRVGDTLRFQAEDGSEAKGRIIRVGETIDAATQTVKVFVQLSSKGLRDGLYVSGTIDGGSVEEAIAVPRSALTDDGALYTVKDSLLARNPVSILHQGMEQAVVRGIAEGQWVVTDRMSGAFEGMRVAPVKP